MPVRSLNSRVLKWPDETTVRSAVEVWARAAAADRDDLLAVGIFGSYARGAAGPGSDVDVLLVLAGSELPFEHRAGEWDLTSLPVPADVLVYTTAELARMREARRKFSEMVDSGTDWVFRRSRESGA